MLQSLLRAPLPRTCAPLLPPPPQIAIDSDLLKTDEQIKNQDRFLTSQRDGAKPLPFFPSIGSLFS
jgi:hypothetical protein